MAKSDKYGKKWICFRCGCKFYDLHKPTPCCPRCGADQTKKNEEFSQEEFVDEEIETAEDEAILEDEGPVDELILDDELPPLEEELGYDETEEEED